ncbi:hypothetical protein [Paludisphaera borealis]|uniref:Uncharacterized protein n=1 Tax=Paludisphaera borealis TaxID=1387353 RepID=A0A1U7CNE0_9BACT|nr:hypothetical protein [Paludisphaera borealis]APW60455.1 hypothetical protein BSF38_01925 [Paludisphaera borealis]
MIYMEFGHESDIRTEDSEGNEYLLRSKQFGGTTFEPHIKGPVELRMKDESDDRRVEWISVGHYRIADPKASNGEILVHSMEAQPI